MKRLVFVLVPVLMSLSVFAQNPPNVDWSAFNDVKVCGEIGGASISTQIQEMKIKKILQQKEVTFDVGQAKNLEINGTQIPSANCAVLPISQVSVGTTVRCVAILNEQKFYIYIRRLVNLVSGQPQQTVNVMTDDNQISALSSCSN